MGFIKERIKKILKKFGLFDVAKKIQNETIIRKRLTKKYKFENRQKKCDKVCLILAGYKPFLYEVIFKRIKKFIPNDIDVCICSSGIYSEELSRIAEKNGWSYLSTKRNNVSLIQNVAINLFENAKYIYKLDEDIFITEGFFETLMKTYCECKKNSLYTPGIVGPEIPVNGFGNTFILDRFNLSNIYKERFETPSRAPIRTTMIDTNPDVAKFFWGEGGKIRTIDEMNSEVRKDKFDYEICPIRFSIGAIFFTREFLLGMKTFKVSKGSGMGSDEEQICTYCMSSSQPIIISKNSIVGHLSFGPQNPTMKKYFEEHKEVFDINEEKLK